MTKSKVNINEARVYERVDAAIGKKPPQSSWWAVIPYGLETEEEGSEIRRSATIKLTGSLLKRGRGFLAALTEEVEKLEGLKGASNG